MPATDATHPSSNTLGRAVPVFCVASVPASIDHYTNVLGFKLDWEVPEVSPPSPATAAISSYARTIRGTPAPGPGSE